MRGFHLKVFLELSRAKLGAACFSILSLYPMTTSILIWAPLLDCRHRKGQGHTLFTIELPAPGSVQRVWTGPSLHISHHSKFSLFITSTIRSVTSTITYFQAFLLISTPRLRIIRFHSFLYSQCLAQVLPYSGYSINIWLVIKINNTSSTVAKVVGIITPMRDFVSCSDISICTLGISQKVEVNKNLLLCILAK